MTETIAWGSLGVAASLALVLILYFGRRTRSRQVLDEKQAYLKGVHYLLVDDTDSAIEALTRVVEVNTETTETYFALGALFRRKGELERATRIHQNILLRPGLSVATRAEARFELGLDYRSGGLMTRAETALREAVDGAPRDWKGLPTALAQLRDVCLETGEVALAVEAQRQRMRHVETDEGSMLSHLLAEQGRSLLDEGHNEEAKAVLKDALKADPSCVPAQFESGRLAIASEDSKRALKHFNLAIDCLPEVIARLYPVLADHFYKQGEFEALGSFLQAAIERHPEAAHLRLAIARHRRACRMSDRAIESLRIALELNPGFHEAQQELGRLLLEEGQGADVRALFEAVLEAKAAQGDFVCERCGHESARLPWRCPRCGAWGTLRASAPGHGDSSTQRIRLNS